MIECANGKVFNYSTSRCRKTCKMRGLVENVAKGTCHKPCKTIKVRNPQFRCVTPSSSSTVTDTELNKDIVNNLNFINDYISEGKEYKDVGVEYGASPIFFYLMAIYFSERYNTECIMPIYKSTSSVSKKNSRISILTKCILTKNPKVLVLPMMVFPNNKPGKVNTSSHANMLFFFPRERYVVRFEPHGGVTYNAKVESSASHSIKYIMTLLNSKMRIAGEKPFRYYKADNICPRNVGGFQAIGENAVGGKKENGFCVMWTWFFASCVIENPNVPINDVFKGAHNIMKNDPDTFIAAIRGYLLAMDRELRKIRIFTGKLNNSPRMVGPSKYQVDGYVNHETVDEVHKFFEEYMDNKNKN